MSNENEKLSEMLFEYAEKWAEEKEQVQSEAYLKWLINFTEKNNSWNDESFLYSNLSSIDNDNVALLDSFQAYVAKKAEEQFILDDSDIDYYDFNFKLSGNYYKISTIAGQGCLTYIEKLDTIPENCVLMDEDVPLKLLKERELIEYIIINKDINISPAKIAVHVGHACTIAALSEESTVKFKKWYNNKYNQKKIILKASQKKLEELEENFYSVRDNGLTEVDKGTLIAVSLGIMSRKEAAQYIKRLQTWEG